MERRSAIIKVLSSWAPCTTSTDEEEECVE
jgi:hypothetical protein